MKTIYLDYNATSPVDEEVLEAMFPYFSESFGNAASTTHPYGWVAKHAVNSAQEQVAHALVCEKQQIIFTSGSTESINLGILGVWELYAKRKDKHIITCQTEHKAVLDTCAYLEKYHGAQITYLPVNSSGLISLKELKQELTDKTILVCIMHANNETGVIQDIKKISEITHSRHSIFMSDCTQSVGKIPLRIDELGIDICCISAHKFYGPKGCGALYFRRKSPRVRLMPQIHGGGHQRGLRAGTLNVPGIVGLGKAISLATAHQATYQAQVSTLRDYLEHQLTQHFEITILGGNAHRLPNTSNVHFKNIDAFKLIELTNGAMAVSTGSACTSATLKPSHVLKAMVGEVDNFSSIRFSLGKHTTKEELNEVISILKERFKLLKNR